MKDEKKSKNQLVTEIENLRQKVSELEGEQAGLKDLDAAFQTIVEQSLQGMMIIQDGRVVFANQRAAELSGFTLDEFLARSPEEIMAAIHPDDRERASREMQNSLTGKPVLPKQEYRIFRKDGSDLWIELLAAPIQYRGKRAVQIAYLDITERKQAEEELRASEARLRTVIEDQTEMINRYKPDFTLTFVNEAYCPIYDKKREELIGQSVLDLAPEENRKSLKKHITSLSRNNPVGTREEKMVLSDGETRWHQWTNRAIFDKQGKIIEYQGVGRDITERKQATEALQKERDLTQKYLDVAGVMIVALNPDGEVTLINKRGCEVLGYREEEIIGKNWIANFLPKEVKARVRQIFTQLIAGELEPIEYNENPLLCVNGEEKIIAWHNSLVRDEEGNITHTLSSGEDITLQVTTEEALRTSEARYRAVIEDQTEMISRFDLDFKHTFVNDAYCRIFGKSRDEIIGKDKFAFIREEDREIVREIITSINQNNPIVTCENRAKTPDGAIRWSQWTNRAIFDKQGKIIEYQGVGRDITDRKQAEIALKASEQKYRNLFDSNRDGIIIVSIDGETVEANQALRDMLGYSEEELSLLTYKQITPDKWAEYEADIVANQVLKRGYSDEFEKEYIKKDGTIFPISIRVVLLRDEQGNPWRMWGSVRDITERKQAEKELKRANEELNRYIERLERRNLEMSLLSEMGDLLQSCREVKEAYMVFGDYAEKLFPDQSGAIYVVTTSQSLLEPVVSWGEPPPSEEAFDSNACWAVRRGQLHLVQSPGFRLHCKHVKEVAEGGKFHPYLCIPMSAQGKLLGILHVRVGTRQVIEEWEQLAITVAERVALAITNIKLRAELQR